MTVSVLIENLESWGRLGQLTPAIWRGAAPMVGGSPTLHQWPSLAKYTRIDNPAKGKSFRILDFYR